MNAKLGSTETLEITFFLLISSDLCHKKMMLESLNIPLRERSHDVSFPDESQVVCMNVTFICTY